jgi:hypothetical protein
MVQNLLTCIRAFAYAANLRQAVYLQMRSTWRDIWLTAYAFWELY